MVATSGLFRASRLKLYGYAVAAIYVLFLVSVYRAGTWILDTKGAPIYTDFACAWAAALQAIHGQVALLYDPAKFVEMQAAVIGPGEYFYPNWPYPPTFFLIFAPFAVLHYSQAFLAWDVLTLLAGLVVVYLIVRHPAAIALFLASPFTFWNFLAAHNGFLTASLLGGSLLFLERRPLLAGVFIGCLTCKPQFGVLVPVALLAAREWRTIVSAAITAALLAGAAVAAFGAGAWTGLPRGFVAQAGLNFPADPASNWGYLQTTYGLIRLLHGSAALAWLGQAVVTSTIAVVVWLVWRSNARYPLKAATLSAGAVIASPYAFAYDLAAIAIPVAFLARDQISFGLLKGEQTIAVALFGAALAVLIIFGDRPGGITFGSIPVGTIVAVTLFGLICHRILFAGRYPSVSHQDNPRQQTAMAGRAGIPSLAG
jgi:arabinofuranan 3-O-arabinosyltransferase